MAREFPPGMDEERTLVDPRFSRSDGPSEATVLLVEPTSTADSDSAFEASRHALSSRRRSLLEAAVLLALFVGLGAVVYQERRVADALQEAIDEIEAHRRGLSLPTLAAPVDPGPGSTRAVSGVELPADEVTPDQRAELEHRGASLLASNDFSNALTLYRGLTKRFRHERVFRDVVIVLEAKLGCTGSRCP